VPGPIEKLGNTFARQAARCACSSQLPYEGVLAYSHVFMQALITPPVQFAYGNVHIRHGGANLFGY
jgi:hypothetical protein